MPVQSHMPSAPQPHSFEGMSREMWHLDGIDFKLDEPRLKAEGKIDYGKRLSFARSRAGRRR